MKQHIDDFDDHIKSTLDIDPYNEYDNIIVGAGPAGLQLAYYFEKNNISYLILEKHKFCATFFNKYPISNKLISLNKKYTGETNPDFNLRHDWNSLLNDEQFLFSDITDELYPEAHHLYNYLNEFANKFNIKINFDENVNVINKINIINCEYEIITEKRKYKCKKLIIASGLSKPFYPVNITPPKNHQIKHYADLDKDNFINNIHKYKNKTVIIIGGGNASYELANLLDKVCSTVLISGSKKKLSIVSHYVGDIRSIYLPFLDSFYLKSLNGIDVFDKNNKFTITINEDETSENYGKYYIKNMGLKDMYHGTKKLTCVDDIIFCTGWTFDSSIFNFNVSTIINDKYPEVNSMFESSNNKNLYFIGALMHSRDYKKSSGGFIHGFRYLIKLFMQINYNIPKIIFYFNFNGTMSCYDELTKHIFNRINYASSLYQLYGTMCDIFYYNKEQNKIIYIQDWTIENIKKLNIHSNNINILKLEYGEEEFIINKLGSFNRWNPSFLHPKIRICSNYNGEIELIDLVTFTEDLIADFSSNEFYNKINQTLKMCNLII